MAQSEAAVEPETTVAASSPMYHQPAAATAPGTEPGGETCGETGIGPAAPPQAFVAMSRFRIANGMTDQVKAAFRERPHLVDDAPGFLRMEVISPMDAPEEIWLLTYWTDEASYRTWHHGHTYRDSHRGIPKGLRLDPKGTEIRFFEHVCS